MKKLIVPLLVLCLCTTASQNARAAADVGLKGVGVQVGMVNAENMDSAFGFGVFGDLGTVAPNFRLAPHLDYWSKSEEAFGTTATISDVVLGMRGEYMFPVSSPRFQPFAGAGLGMHFLNAKVEAPGFPTMTDSESRLGLEIGGGFTSPVNPRTDFLGELWYGVVSDFNQLSIRAGLKFKLGS